MSRTTRLSITGLRDRLRSEGLSDREIAELLGMSRRDISPPEPSVTIWKADEIAVHRLGQHPAAVFGIEEWLQACERRQRAVQVARERRYEVLRDRRKGLAA